MSLSSLRILHCLRAPVGGLFRHVCDLARGQAALGHQVGIVCDANTTDVLTERRFAVLSSHLALGIHRVAMGREVGASDIAAVQFVRQLAGRLQPDIVHGHGAKGGAAARLAVLGKGLCGPSPRCFYTPHGGSLHYDPRSLLGRIYMAAERQMARMTDGIIFESAYAARQFAIKVGSVGCATRVVHNGVAEEDFDAVIPTPDAADFLFVGELRVLKGVDLLLDALAHLKAERSVSVAIVGSGPDADAFKSRAEALGLGAHVSFKGALPARDAFRLGRVLVVPSRAESLPYVVLEGVAAGLPVIATDVGGIAEIVSGSDTDLVPPGDVERLGAAMRATLTDPAGARARAERLRDIVAGRFSVAAMTRGVHEFYVDTAKAKAA